MDFNLETASIEALLKSARRQCYIALHATKTANELLAKASEMLNPVMPKTIVRRDPVTGSLHAIEPDDNSLKEEINQDVGLDT